MKLKQPRGLKMVTLPKVHIDLRQRPIWIAAVVVCLGADIPNANGALLVYEGFDYAAESAVSGKNGGTGWASNGTSQVAWDTDDSGAGFVATQPSGVPSGVKLNNGTSDNPYTNTFTNFQQRGGYAGPSDGNDQAPHETLWRTLHPSVTATFMNGNTTWISFATARSYNSTASRAPSFAIGAGILMTGLGQTDRGDTSRKVNDFLATFPNTAGGGGTYNGGAVLNGSQDFNSRELVAIGGSTENALAVPAGYYSMIVDGVGATNISKLTLFFGQKYNVSGVRTRSEPVGWNGTTATLSNAGAAGTLSSAPADHGFWMQGGGGTTNSPLRGYSSLNSPVTGFGDNKSHINIVVGKIQWGAGSGGSDRVSYAVFHDSDALTEANFDAWARTWDTGAPSNKASFNQLSIAGARYFVDEIHVGTAFADMITVPGGNTYPQSYYAGKVQALSPLGYWQLNEVPALSTPTTALNIGTLGAAADGTYSAGGVTINAAGPPNPPNSGMGIYNTSASFNGSGNVNCGNNAAFNGSPFSVCAWVKSSGFSNSMTIIAKGGSLWRLACNNASNTLQWTVPGGGVSGSLPVADGNWHHVVATAGPGGTKLYVDGVQDGVTGGPYDNSVNSDPLWIGSQGNPGSFQWIGTIDEAAFFGTELSGAQALALYAARVVPPPAGPGPYWSPSVGGGGTGNWNSSSTVWNTVAGDQGSGTQSLTAPLIFGDNAGTVTVDGTVTVKKGLQFSTDNYVLAAGAGPNLSMAGTTLADNTVTVDTGLSATINAPVSGTFGFAKDGAGNLLLGAANTITGTASLLNGTVTVNNQNALQNNTVSMGGASVVFGSSVVANAFNFGMLASSGDLTLENDAAAPIALTVGAGNSTSSYSGALSGAGSLVKSGNGTLILSSGSSTFSGGTTVLAGTIKPNRKECFGSGPVTLAGGVIFNQSNDGTGFEGNGPGGAYPNTFFLSGGEVTFNVAFGGATDIWTNTEISGPGSIKVIGSGRLQGLTLQGLNTFSGGVKIAGPDTPNLQLFNNASLGTGTLTTTVTSTNLDTGGLRIQANLTDVPNVIDLPAGARLLVDTSPGAGPFTATFTGVISGAGDLVKNSAGTMELTNPANNYTGTTKVRGGILKISSPGALGANALAIELGGLVDLNYIGAREIATLSIGGVAQPNGTYGSSTSVPTPLYVDDIHFSGTGVVRVGPDAYLTWVASYGLIGADSGPDADPDNDGLANGIEFVTGQNPNVGSASPLRCEVSGSDVLFAFDRTVDSKITSVTVAIEVSPDMSPFSWGIYTVPEASLAPFDVLPNGATETVILTVPRGTEQKMFGRLKVLITP